MAHYGMLRDYRFTDDVDDIRGSALYGLNDEKLGKIDDVIFGHASGTIQYAVVDSGGWFSSKKFLVPAERIRPYSKDEDDFYTDMTKQQIEALPRYDEDKFSKDKTENERDWTDYNERYRKSLETDGGVMHREASTHTITPDASELPATGEPLPDESAYEPDRVAGVFTATAPNPNKTRMRPSGLASRAEDSAAPGQFVPREKTTWVEENALDGGAGKTSMRKPVVSNTETGAHGAVETLSSTRPVQEQRDDLRNPDRVYNSEATRHRRLATFEDHLRRNRVDITASCRSCATKEDKVA